MAQQTDDRSPALKLAPESMALLIAGVIVHDKAADRFVLFQRSWNAKFAQGLWDLPVGKSEPDEPITETAVRELYEETGLTVKPESLKVAHIIHGPGVSKPPMDSSRTSSPPTNGRGNLRTTNSVGPTLMPSPTNSSTPAPFITISRTECLSP
ncbi:NUDIX domain-containing protein [Actinacidiphila yanglinensis]|uniref:NUDIX domain-containing protein n=1 Tax=Actinacidiphila yanglinensis TaxID=310779 RepID=A0A1H6DLY8_9ACTN|nr:NUDIX domain-containing protein [Actinacidiphila yanglinensis]